MTLKEFTDNIILILNYEFEVNGLNEQKIFKFITFSEGLQSHIFGFDVEYGDKKLLITGRNRVITAFEYLEHDAIASTELSRKIGDFFELNRTIQILVTDFPNNVELTME